MEEGVDGKGAREDVLRRAKLFTLIVVDSFVKMHQTIDLKEVVLIYLWKKKKDNSDF